MSGSLKSRLFLLIKQLSVPSDAFKMVFDRCIDDRIFARQFIFQTMLVQRPNTMLIPME